MSLDKKTSTDIVSGGNKTPLVIFKTKEDRNETDISKMSNFFEDYVHEMTLSIRESSHLQEIMELPIADLSVTDKNNVTGLCPKHQKGLNDAGAVAGVGILLFGAKKFGPKILKGAIKHIKR